MVERRDESEDGARRGDGADGDESEGFASEVVERRQGDESEDWARLGRTLTLVNVEQVRW